MIEKLQHLISTGISFFVIAIVFSLSDCGGGGGGGGTNETMDEFFRVVHGAIEVETIEVELGSEPPQKVDLAFGENSGYIDAPEGEKIPLNVKREDDILASITSEIKIESGKAYTYLVTSTDESIEGTLLTDDNTLPDATRTRVRFVNLSVVDGVDVYITRGSTDLDDVDPIAAGVAVKAASAYFSIDADDYKILFTRAGKSSVLASTQTLPFGDKSVRTVVLFEDFGGGTPYHAEVLTDRN